MEREYYERYWSGHDSEGAGFAASPPEWNAENLRRILNAGGSFIAGRVLDVGCGSGFFTAALSRLPDVEECVGLDVSQTAIEKARTAYQDSTFCVGSGAYLPFRSDSFDSIVAIETIEHVIDIELIFKEFNRVLKDGGYLILTTTDFNLLKKLVISLFFFDKYFYPTNPHIRFFTKLSLERCLKSGGFVPKKHKWNGSYLGIMPKGQIMIAKKWVDDR